MPGEEAATLYSRLESIADRYRNSSSIDAKDNFFTAPRP